MRCWLCERLANRWLVLDLSTGSRNSIAADVPFVEGNLADGALVRRAIEEHGADAVVKADHLAGRFQSFDFRVRALQNIPPFLLEE